MLNLSRFINRFVVLAALVAICCGSSGCAVIGKGMNPFESDFVDCSSEENIDACSSVDQSYSMEVSPKKHAKKVGEPKDEKVDGSGQKTISLIEEADSSYRAATLQKMTKLLKEPVTPMVAPPTVLRVLILPYKDDDDGLNLMRHTYIMVDKPRWIMGDYLEEQN